jgi:hypothetical protein
MNIRSQEEGRKEWGQLLDTCGSSNEMFFVLCLRWSSPQKNNNFKIMMMSSTLTNKGRGQWRTESKDTKKEKETIACLSKEGGYATRSEKRRKKVG